MFAVRGKFSTFGYAAKEALHNKRFNGAGKTTASFNILPDLLNCKEFVNADEIARGISPFQPENVSIKAGRLMLKRIDELINSNQNFSF